MIGRYGTAEKKSKNRFKKQANEYSLLYPGDRKTRRVVRVIFYLRYKRGWRGCKIADYLNHLGIRAPKGGEWSPRQVESLYENEAYTGVTFNDQTFSGRFFRRDREMGFVAINRDECEMVMKKTFPPTRRPMSEWDRIDQPHMYDFLPQDLRDLAIAALHKMWDEREDPTRPKKKSTAFPASHFLLSNRLRAIQDEGLLTGTMTGREDHQIPYYRQANITAWRATAPWPDEAQVEQDLVLSRAVVELFGEPKLSGKIALRGGTALNKLYIRPQCRYSEDIDLVQTQGEPIGPVLDAIRGKLDPWLGKPARKSSGGNVTLAYRFESEIAPIRQLRLKIEINTREHFTVLGLTEHQLNISNPWFTGAANLKTYQLDELLGTKLRALYQRRKSRDLFDLWLCLERKLINPAKVVGCFGRYMEHEGHAISRAQFEQNLHGKQSDPEFMDDIAPLLSAAVDYDPGQAMSMVRDVLIVRIPGEPWRGDDRMTTNPNKKSE